MLFRTLILVPSNVQSASREALLYVFEDNEAVIKMIMKGRSPTMRHVARTHRVALDWLFDRINLDPKIQIKYIDTKNQLADILTKGNFTRDEWNHLLTLFNISHFSSTACTAAMAKRAQQGSGEERVTAKSRPMMNLTARMPSVVSSTSSNPGMTSYGYQDPGKSVASDDRSVKPENSSPPGYTQEDYGRSWSSQEWKSGAVEHDRSGKPEKTSWDMMQKVDPHREEPLLGGNAHSARYGETIHDGSGKPETVNHQEEANSENFVMESDAAEFVNKVQDQLRSRQKRMSNVADSGEEQSIFWGMCMAATMNAATLVGKNFSTIPRPGCCLRHEVSWLLFETPAPTHKFLRVAHHGLDLPLRVPHLIVVPSLNGSLIDPTRAYCRSKSPLSSLSFFCKGYRSSHFEANVRYHCESGGRTRRDQCFGEHSLGKEFMETTVPDW